MYIKPLIALLTVLASGPALAAGNCNWGDSSGCEAQAAEAVDQTTVDDATQASTGLREQPKLVTTVDSNTGNAAADSQLAGQVVEEEDGACKILLCMSVSGSAPNACRSGIKKFEKIRKTKHGHFSPSRTVQARRKKLDECDGGDMAKKEAIIAAWGAQPYIIGAWKFY